MLRFAAGSELVERDMTATVIAGRDAGHISVKPAGKRSLLHASFTDRIMAPWAECVSQDAVYTEATEGTCSDVLVFAARSRIRGS